MTNPAAAARPLESAAVADFLNDVNRRPSALVFEGDAGIGKTAVWLWAVDQARLRGRRVLTARTSASESVLAYASLADLLRGVDTSVFDALPEPQRRALYGALLLDAPDVASDPRAVAAGFLSVIEILAADSPLLIAVDDLQWLDASSAGALSFAGPRLTGAVALLATARTDPRDSTSDPPLRMPRPDDVRRMRLQPFSIGALHTILAQRLGRTYSRPVMVRIHQLSGGNPLYALELARSLGDAVTLADVPLSGSLAEVVRKRVGALDPDQHEILLAASCVDRPTVELVARACGKAVGDAATILEAAEGKGIVGLEGHHVRFSHPILARAVYTGAASGRRRATHRRLAAIIDEPELRAKHLALGAIVGDRSTLHALDAAAECARMRGAPAAAAELTDLAIGLGGDTPQRRIASARHHFNAGNPARAHALLEETMAQLEPGVLRAEAANLLGYVRLLDDNFPEAAELLQRALPDAAGHPAVLVSMLVTLSFALFNAGDIDAARQCAEDAVENAEKLGAATLLSEALSMRTMVGFLRGDGVDEPSVCRALALEDPRAAIPMALRPSAHHAVLRSMVGELDRADEELTALRRRCIEHGDEGDLMFVAYHAALNSIWRGNFTEAALIAEDSMELAQQLGGDVSLSVALTNRALLAAFLGRTEEARDAVAAAHAASIRSGSVRLGEWPTNTLGFLEVSLGNYNEALTVLEPMVARVRAAPRSTEIIAAWFIPDAVEAMVNTGRSDSAEPLVAALETNGRRLDRAWMLAIGGRCRAMVSASRGDVVGAVAHAQQAMSEHARLPMPFERARTQLLLGQLQRRQRLKDTAAATLRGALETFDELGTPLWVDRVRAELGRANVGRHRTSKLTPSEQRVAELAADGMTNRNIAMAMFISPKTVEANLSRVYAKLGIHSRAELGRYMGQTAK